MSTQPIPQPGGMAGIFATIGNLIAPNLSDQVDATEQQLQLAFAALMGAQIVIIAELFIIAVVVWKDRSRA